jgi:ketosteroid isomerase-like protein
MPNPSPPNDARVARLKQYFASLTIDSVSALASVYTEDAWFKDPFNEVRGLRELERVFRHMFQQVHDPRFVVTRTIAAGDDAFLTWDFLFRLHGSRDREQVIRGASHIQFAPDGRVAYHRDYWDAAEELYEKLPVLGGLMRFLKRRAAG